MLYIMDWISGKDQTDELTRNLFEMTWYDADEFLGYLAHVLKGKKRMEKDLVEYENLAEKSWRLFIEGLISEKTNDHFHARKMFELSILTSDIDDWVYFLSFSRLNRIEEAVGKDLKDKKTHQEDVKSFIQKAANHRKEAAGFKETISTMIEKFESGKLSYEENSEIYGKMMDLAPENLTMLGKAAFYHAENGGWKKAVEMIDRYFSRSPRETGLGLSLGLLKGEILAVMEKKNASTEYLKAFSENIHDPFYRAIIKHVLENTDETFLIRLAGKKPEKLITLHTALGLWAEGQQNPEKASHHYREALGTYLENWNEYSLSLGRLTQLRKPRE